jgi:probable F420-dependent oxidoreductase
MLVSLGLPTCMEGMMYPVPFISPDQLIEIAKLAERLGYHSVWGNDHMTTQRYVRAEFSQPPNFWEILITLSFIAAETTSLRIATGVLVPAMRRDMVVLAKQLATLDQFSKGRLMVGMGVGAYREEFEALNPDWQVKRGDLLEESIQVLQVLFSQRNASWQGAYFHFEDVEMYPKPHQAPLPVYVGGNNVNARRRAALYAQGWMGAGMPVQQLKQAVARLHDIASLAGRDPLSIDIAPQFVACIAKSHEDALRRFRSSQMYNHLVSLSGTTLKDQVEAGVKFEEIDLIGTAADIIEKIEALREVGVTHVSGLLFPANNYAEYQEQIQWFAEEVIPNVSR